MLYIRTQDSELCPYDRVFRQELHWLYTNNNKQLIYNDYIYAQHLNDTVAEEEGSKIECQCCYDIYPIDNIIQCSNGHLFCKVCVQRYIEETMFGSGSVYITCISTEKYYDNYTTTNSSGGTESVGGAESEVCNGRFSDEMVKMCLSELVYDKYQGRYTV